MGIFQNVWALIENPIKVILNYEFQIFFNNLTKYARSFNNS